MSELNWHLFETSEALARELADDVARRLDAAIAENGAAIVAVSGGSTPRRFFELLSRAAIDWPHVTVCLVDERFVPPSSERSNARLVTETLLQNEAAMARFVPLYHPVLSAEQSASIAAEDMAALPLPFDVIVLGMGTDGHTASVFPDASDAKALESNEKIVAVHAPSAVEPRLTLPVSVISQARTIVLHIEGAEKRDILKDALASQTQPPLPIRTVLDAAEHGADIYWAPSDKERS